MRDILTPYENGLDLLLEELGENHSRYTDALTFEQRLRENLSEVRKYKDNEETRSNRARVISELNQLAMEELGKSFNQLCGFETSDNHLKGVLNVSFLRLDIPPDLPFYEKIAALLVDSFGQIREETIGVAASLLGLLILSAIFASWLAQNGQGSNLGLLLGGIWAGLTILPLIPGFLPQEREKSLRCNYHLTPRQRLALVLDKLLGTYVSAYLIEIGSVVLRILLDYLGLWSRLGLVGQGIFWFIVEWLAFIMAFVGAVIAIKYWENILGEENPVKLQAQHFLLGLGFPLIVYPSIMMFAILTAEIWEKKEFGCTVLGLSFLFIAYLFNARRSAKYDRFAPRLRLEKSVTPSESSPPQPSSQLPSQLLQHPRRERIHARFKLQLARLVGPEFEVRALETPMGEPRATTRLPYDQETLIAILKALPAASLKAAKLTPAQADTLRDLGLLTNPSLVSDLHARVGGALYRSLFPGDVGAAFQVAWTQVRAQRGLVSLQLRFDEDAVALARYPWELMYDRRHLLPGGAVELTRYISYAEAPTPLSIKPPLRLLYVESRPTDLDSLPVGEERKAVRAALEEMEAEGLLLLETLTSPTYDALIDRVESAHDHVLHFDGHGTVARRCPACGGMNYPHHTICQRPGCDRTLTDVLPLGYLAFEKKGSRRVDWVNSKILEYLLYPSTVRVAVLSACSSGEVRGETLFGGVGPALIQAGVPAVVTMQVPISASAATRFVQGFYSALARFDSLPAAMTSGRRCLSRDREWFIPVLYLRSQDEDGQLFKSTV